MKKRYFLVSIILHSLPLILLLFVFSDQDTSSTDEVNALMVSITGTPGLEIGSGGGNGRNSRPGKAANYGLPSSDIKDTGTGLSGQGGGTGPDSPTTYAGQIIKSINEHKYYPPQARLSKLTGNVELGFIVNYNGDLNERINILSSSGHKLLDDTAIRIIKSSAPFPAFPESIKEKELNLKVTIDFTI